MVTVTSFSRKYFSTLNKEGLQETKVSRGMGFQQQIHSENNSKKMENKKPNTKQEMGI
jgi:hypothetical protein